MLCLYTLCHFPVIHFDIFSNTVVLWLMNSVSDAGEDGCDPVHHLLQFAKGSRICEFSSQTEDFTKFDSVMGDTHKHGQITLIHRKNSILETRNYCMFLKYQMRWLSSRFGTMLSRTASLPLFCHRKEAKYSKNDFLYFAVIEIILCLQYSMVYISPVRFLTLCTTRFFS